jgi:alpha-glucan,water dikinase
MNKTETVKTRSGLSLHVETRLKGEHLEVSLQAPLEKNCILHWGLRRPSDDSWQTPPEPNWPSGTSLVGKGALETPFSKQNGQASLNIHLNASAPFAFLDFVLFFPDQKQWDNNDGRNYWIALQPSVRDSFRELLKGQETVFERIFDIDGKWQLAAAVTKPERPGGSETAAANLCLSLLTNLPAPLLLHWGIARRSPHEWLLPPESMRGSNGTVLEQAAQTPFTPNAGFNLFQLAFPEQNAPMGIQFVLKQTGEPGRWFKHRGGNFYIPTQPVSAHSTSLEQAQVTEIADEIIRAETTHNSWTLMHRFNLAHDLLDRAQNNPDVHALLYVWLRFSAIRQLTWQRNYNTKPRELAHAQDRLTSKLSEIYRKDPVGRPLARLTLATVGRGGEGQRIRDEILNIMHRHHVKEVSGHFLEEWHQKLHNNTTPDDVVICEAFIEFLKSNGNLERFYQTLQAGGVTRERLRGFERPIRSDPQFVSHLKDALIHDFHNFLRILKESHSGTDLETALNAARSQLDGDLQGRLNYLWEHRNDPNVPLTDLVWRLTDIRRRLSDLLLSSQRLRELLYLDLALEQMLRGLVERNIHLHLSAEQLAGLIAAVLENVTLTYEDQELGVCSRHWERLQSMPRFTAEWSLHAKSVVDRIARALGAWIDHFYQLLQPKAEYLGRGFQVEEWTIKLFSEEVVRGASLGFVLSILLRHLDPLLRQAAQIGNWQIVSPGRGAGEVKVVQALRTIQQERFDKPVVIVAEAVMGDEDIPDGVTAVIAPDVTDIVSHVAVRARNASLLFASCHDAEMLDRLKSMQGQFIELEVTPAGDVLLKEAKPQPPKIRTKPTSRFSLTRRSFTKYAVGIDQFNSQFVGGKACHLAELRGKLSDWIQLPLSVAVPFGVFEKVLESNSNKDVAKEVRDLSAQAQTGQPEVLAKLRQTLLSLSVPQELSGALREVMMQAGMGWPDDWTKTSHRIKQVWASKWNDRAFLSRKRLGIPDEHLSMSVLIQQVVPADYAFVLHTVNPSNANPNQLFGEVVLGLGETLVGNYPGRALSFTWDKESQQAKLLSYPSKGVALYGGGLIFRSDSNGEDLEGFAGAGLYDSVLLDSAKQVAVDYTDEPLVWDEGFRKNLFISLSRLGLELEKTCGLPQDAEGAVFQGKYYLVQTRPQVGLSPAKE